MTTVTDNAPRRKARLLWLGMSGVIFLGGTAVACLWWFALKTASDERRPFVGTWRVASPVATVPDLVSEMDLFLDGTIRQRVRNTRTTEILYEETLPAHWRLSNGRYQEVLDKNPLMAFLDRRGPQMLLDVVVCWDGPDRFSYQGPPPQKLSTVWVRCDPTTNR